MRGNFYNDSLIDSRLHIERLSIYNKADAEAIGKLMPFLSDNFIDTPIDMDLIKAIIDSPYHEQIVARIHNRIVGAATLSIVMGAGSGKKGYLEDFVVDREYREFGIGQKIWNEIIRWCTEQNINLQFTSNPKRLAAHDFYRKNGAEVLETTVFRYKQ